MDFFNIKNQDNIYNAVGQIIKASQEWEMQYKEYARRLKLDMQNYDYATIRRLNFILREKNVLSEKEFNDLQQVVALRNYINHEFFLKDFYKDEKELNDKLNNIMFLIYEATDLIANMIERLEGFDQMRKTIFD